MDRCVSQVGCTPMVNVYTFATSSLEICLSCEEAIVSQRRGSEQGVGIYKLSGLHVIRLGMKQ